MTLFGVRVKLSQFHGAERMYKLEITVKNQSIITSEQLEQGDLGVVTDGFWAGAVVLKTAIGIVILKTPSESGLGVDGWATGAKPCIPIRLLQPGDSVTLTVSR